MPHGLSVAFMRRRCQPQTYLKPVHFACQHKFYYTRDAMLARYQLWAAVCASVRHGHGMVLCQNG